MPPLRSITIVAITFVAVMSSCASPALGDGGTVQFSKVVAPFRITVFTSPAPLSAGIIDISVLVQDANSGKVVQDAIIDLEVSRETVEKTIRAQASRKTSTNKLLQTSEIEFPSAGVWRVSIRVEGTQSACATFDMTIVPPSGDALSLIVGLSIPGIMVILFIVREHLVAHQSSSARSH